MTIRPMHVGDLEEVMALERAAFHQPWGEEIFKTELAAPGRRYLTAEHGGEVIGYGGLMLVGDDAHITTLAAARPAPVPAVGSRLMLTLIEAALAGGAQQLTLEVRASNRAAQDFYRKFGMGPVGVRKHYYRDEDAIIMWVHDLDGPDYARRLEKIREDLP